MQVTCSCGKVLNVPDTMAGKNARCPGCQRLQSARHAAGAGVSGRQKYSGGMHVRQEACSAAERSRKENPLPQVQPGNRGARRSEARRGARARAGRRSGCGCASPGSRTARRRARQAAQPEEPAESSSWIKTRRSRQSPAGLPPGFTRRPDGKGRIRPQRAQMPQLQGRSCDGRTVLRRVRHRSGHRHQNQNRRRPAEKGP